MYVCIYLFMYVYKRKFLVEENFGKFGKSLVVCQILLKSCDIYVKKAYKQNFAKVLLCKSFWWEIYQSFLPQKFVLYDIQSMLSDSSHIYNILIAILESITNPGNYNIGMGMYT